MIYATPIIEQHVQRRVQYRRPWMYDEQYEAIFSPARYAFIEAATKTGKTVGCLLWFIEQSLSARDGDNTWWIAPWYGTAKIAYTRFQRSVKSYPRLFTFHDGDMMAQTVNGVRMWFKSGDKPDTLYGDDVKAAVIDEASRTRTETWHAVRSTLTATGGKARCIGNVKGKKNWFYTLARKAEAQQLRDAVYRRLTWRHSVKAGLLPQSEIDDAKSVLPPHVFQELYEAIPTDDSGNPFRYRVAPIQPGPAVAWGWDLAKKANWTVGVGLNQFGGVCAIERFQLPWMQTVERIREATKQVPALIDSTGVGDPILEILQRGVYTGGVDEVIISQSHRKSIIEESTQRKAELVRSLALPTLALSNFEGYIFTAPSKQRLMEQLAVALNSWLLVPEGPLTAELDVFEYYYSARGVRYSAPDGFDDDCVMALALAVNLWSRDNGLSGPVPNIRSL